MRSSDKVDGNKLFIDQFQTNSKKGLGDHLQTQNKSKACKIKNHPRINDPSFSEFLHSPSSDAASKHRDDPSSPLSKNNIEAFPDEEKSEIKKEEKIESIEYFNLTNLGRLRPAKRESLAEVINLKNDIQEMMKNVQKNLEFGKKDNQSNAYEKRFYRELNSELKPSNLSVAIQKKGDTIKNLQVNTDEFVEKEVALHKILKSETTITNSKQDEGEKWNAEELSKNEQIFKRLSNEEQQQFIIPELPKGKKLSITIFSTWGDDYYVGLCGIEMFDDNGKVIKIKDALQQIRAEPPDINILPGYGKDPRTVDKLVDGTYLTTDDLHLWLAPYTKGKPNHIIIDLDEVHQISMLRFWNYNKSRAHSFRGARDIVVMLDDCKIFQGEISMAPGSIKDAYNYCEYIMFTKNENIITAIEKEDWLNKDTQMESSTSGQLERPFTGDKRLGQGENYIETKRCLLANSGTALIGSDGRPLTSAKLEKERSPVKAEIENNKNGALEETDNRSKIVTQQHQAKEIVLQTSEGRKSQCKRVVINLLNTWGDNFYIGLTGVEFYDGEGSPIPLKSSNLDAKPRDISCSPGYTGDLRLLDSLLNGINQTCSDQNMWLIPFVFGQPYVIYINFTNETVISGMKIWNYNKNSEQASRGVKLLTIAADGELITPTEGLLVRKAPGIDIMDYGQFIGLPFLAGWDESKIILYRSIWSHKNTNVAQEYETPSTPAGFCLKITIFSNWGDLYYVGLNGIELYDQEGEPILSAGRLRYQYAAEPASINSMNKDSHDIRTLDKLFNGKNATFDDRNMWLTPYLAPHLQDGHKWRTDLTTLWIMFDTPIILSAIDFWNYAKTSKRGVREVEICLEDNIIYKGYLREAPTEQEFKAGKELRTTVVFTHSETLLEKIDPQFYTEEGNPQNIIFSNEKKSLNPFKRQEKIPEEAPKNLERPSTSVTGKEKYTIQ